MFSVLALAEGRSDVLRVDLSTLGYEPTLAAGVRVAAVPGSQRLHFAPGRTCVDKIQVTRVGSNLSRLSFEPNPAWEVEHKLAELAADGVAAQYYRDNLAREPGDHVVQLLFMPMILAPKARQVTHTEWTPEAQAILATQGWDGLERHCGTHFVEALGEESYVIYAARIELPDPESRRRLERLNLDHHNQSPSLLLSNLLRLRQRFEFGHPGTQVKIDILRVGGRDSDEANLAVALRSMGATRHDDSGRVARTQVQCAPENLEFCQRVVQLFLDYQFQRLQPDGARPKFAPVHFRIAPLRSLVELNSPQGLAPDRGSTPTPLRALPKTESVRH